MTECKDGHEFHGFVDVQPNKFACMNCNKTLNLYDDYNELLAMLNAAEKLSAETANQAVGIVWATGNNDIAEALRAYAKARGE